jgi:hypothetical protein
MRRLIVAAALAVLSFAALAHAPGHAHASAKAPAAAPVVASHTAPALEAPVTIELPEQTIVGVAPARHAAAKHVETDAEHIARLMSARLSCGDYAATAGTGEIAGTSGAPRVARCTVR